MLHNFLHSKFMNNSNKLAWLYQAVECLQARPGAYLKGTLLGEAMPYSEILDNASQEHHSCY
jgi:hypothetical protein